MKTKVFFLAIVLFCAATASADEQYSGTCGVSVTWRINTPVSDEYGNSYLPHGINGDTLYIEGTGEMSDFRDYNSAPWNRISNYDIRHISIQEGVTYIGKYAFTNMCNYGGNGLWVTIPNTVTTIGYGAFWDSYIYMLTIPNSVTTIGKYAFHGCHLCSINIPSSVSLIDTGAFRYCSVSNDFNVAADNPNYSSPNGLLCNKDQTLLIQCMTNKFNYNFTIPNSIVTIGRYAFAGCEWLRNVTIPANVTTIENYAFSDCSGIDSITVPSSVANLGTGVFERCSYMKSINVVSDNLNYSSLDGVVFNKRQDTLIAYPPGRIGMYSIPNRVTAIAGSAFSSCERLTIIDIPNSVTSIGKSAFAGCKSLVSVTIPDGVTEIASSTFEQCTNLSLVDFGKNITRIGSFAFYFCSSLQSVTLPEGLKVVEWVAFQSCSLSSISIPSTVDSIYRDAFAFNNLEIVYNYAVEPQIVTRDVFCYDSYEEINATLYVPEESIPLYQAADVWNEFNPILPLPKTEAIDNITIDGSQYNFAQKIRRDGQIFILRGDKVYTTTGQEVR